MINWIKKLRHIVLSYDTTIEMLQQKITKAEFTAAHAIRRAESAEEFIRVRTEVSIDLGVRGPNTIIITGRYKNRDYVEIFDIQNQDMNYLVDMLRSMKRHHIIRTIDGPFAMKSIFEDKLNY